MSNNLLIKRKPTPTFKSGEFTSFVLPKDRLTDLISDKSFPDCALHLYLYLLRIGNDKWYLSPKDYIAKTGRSMSTYQRGLKALKEHDILIQNGDEWIFNPF
jgi:hypothetical protein